MQINPRHFDLNLLRVMIAVWETRSISAAAIRIGMSQPATSNALARLRAATGDPIFIRTKDGMIPSSAAEQVLPDLKQHLDGLFDALSDQSGFDPARSTRTFRLSLSGLGELFFLPPLLSEMMHSSPGLRVFNTPVAVEALGHALRTGSVDLAIGLIDVTEAGIRSRNLFQDRYVVVAGAGLTDTPDTIEALRDHQIALCTPGADYTRDTAQLLGKYELQDNVVVRLANFGALPGMLDSMPLISFLPEEFSKHLARQGALRLLPIQINDLRAPVRMVWHEKTSEDPGNLWLRDMIETKFTRPTR